MRKSGMLTRDNFREFVKQFQALLVGKTFAIASAQYADSGDAQVSLITDAKFEPDWTEEAMKRHGISRDTPLLCDESRLSVSFSAGHYFWSFYGDSEGNGRNPDGSRKPHGTYFVFERNCVTLEQMATAGKGYLHKHMFKIQKGES